MEETQDQDIRSDLGTKKVERKSPKKAAKKEKDKERKSILTEEQMKRQMFVTNFLHGRS